MWFIVWKKYEHSSVATGVSMMGNILIIAAALGLAALATQLNGILGIVAGIAGYVGLKIGLNRLTDHIARADLNASVKRYARKSAREEAAQQVKDADLLKVMAEETDQDALYKAIHDSFGQSIIHTKINNEMRFQAAQRLDDEHLKKLIESCKGYFNYNRYLQKRCLEKGEPINEVTVRNMTRLIGMVRDPAERERLMKYYYLKK